MLMAVVAPGVRSGSFVARIEVKTLSIARPKAFQDMAADIGPLLTPMKLTIDLKFSDGIIHAV